MLKAEGLTKSFGALEVTRQVSLEAPAGQRLAIIGPNGAGKTTLFNLLAGELQPSAGRILLDSQDVTAMAPNRRARLGLARSFQKNNLFFKLTVRENLLLAQLAKSGGARCFWRRLSRIAGPRHQAEAVAEQVGLTSALDRPVAALSYGAQRQLEIGLALATAPRVLLLDEPTSGMSPEETQRMLDLVRGLPRDLAVVIIEHDMDMVFGTADRIVVLNYGQVLLEGSPEEVRASPVVQETYLGGGGEALPC
ncbi:MAG: ABC transporter ATP-binding protein [Rhodospirillales bacterium]